MNSRANQQSQNVIEIDLVSLFKQVLLQWRAILIFAIILGVLAGGLRYAKDNSAYKAAIAAKKVSGDQAIETSGLTNEEVDAIKSALTQRKKIEDLATYLNESVYMNLDAMNCRTLSILYYIRAEKGYDAADLLPLYNDMLLSDDSIKKIREASDIDAPAKYIRELISVYDAKSDGRAAMSQDSSTDVMKVIFSLPKGADSTAVESAIEKLIKEYDIRKFGVAKGSIKKISSSVNVTMNTSLQSSQQNYISNLTNLKSTYQSTTSAFSDEQKKLLKTMLAENNLSDPDAVSGEDTENAESTKDQETLTPPSFSKKYFAIGFILAVLIYVFLQVIYDILGSRCSSVAGYGNSFILGSMLDPTRKRHNFLMCDGILMKALYRNETDIDSGLDRVLAKAQMNSSKDSLSSFEIWSIGFNGADNSMISRIVNVAKAHGIDVTVTSVIDRHPDEMISKAEAGRSVAIACLDGKSRKKDAAFITEMLTMRNADYIGQIRLM